jgi:hypothetical protein
VEGEGKKKKRAKRKRQRKIETRRIKDMGLQVR